MPDLRHRSYQPELLDGNNIPYADIRQNMVELNTINTLLGGHAITCKGIGAFLHQSTLTQPLRICEIGCGGGDNLAAIHRFLQKKGIACELTGIDINKDCIQTAKEQHPRLQANWIVSDYAGVSFGEDKPDIIFNSLFCHHFNEKELQKMLWWMKENSRHGFFINDLHRHWLAYHSIKLLTALFSQSYLVKNDAPLSVARGFLKTEWKNIFREAAIPCVSLQWKWAFRHLIIFKHGAGQNL